MTIDKTQIPPLKAKLSRGWVRRFHQHLKFRGWVIEPGSIVNVLSMPKVLKSKSAIIPEFLIWATAEVNKDKQISANAEDAAK